MVAGSAYAMTPGAWKMLGIYMIIGIIIYVPMKLRWLKREDRQPWTPKQEWADEYEKALES